MAASKLAERPQPVLPGQIDYPVEPAVEQFLAQHGPLLPLVSEIAERASDYFPVTRMSLSVLRDPEAIDRDQLAVFIHVDLPLRDALNRLERFDREWWIPNSDRADGLLTVDIAPA